MNPKRTYLILLLIGLTELLLFLVISKNGPTILWQALGNFVSGGEYELWAFIHGMLTVLLILLTISYLLFAPKKKKESEEKHVLEPAPVLKEVDYGKKETEPEKVNPKIEKEENKDTEEEPPIIPPEKRIETSPMFDTPPPGAPTKRPPDSNRKLL